MLAGIKDDYDFKRKLGQILYAKMKGRRETFLGLDSPKILSQIWVHGSESMTIALYRINHFFASLNIYKIA